MLNRRTEFPDLLSQFVAPFGEGILAGLSLSDFFSRRCGCAAGRRRFAGSSTSSGRFRGLLKLSQLLADGLLLGPQSVPLALHRGEFLLVVGFEFLPCGELLRRLGQFG